MTGPSSPLLDSLRRTGREFVRGVLQLLYPNACHLCNRLLPQDQNHFCGECRTALIHDPFPTCPRCAASVGPFVDAKDGCLRCAKEHFAFERVVRLGRYTGLLRDTILRQKYRNGETLAELVGELWAEHRESDLRSLQAEVVLPVPLHWKRRWQRGFNQSALLAEAIARRLQLPYQPRWLRRIHYTEKQAAKLPTARLKNVEGAFAIRSTVPLAGRTVLLVDDLLTTGSTSHEIARVLKKAGAARVVVAVLGRWER